MTVVSQTQINLRPQRVRKLVSPQIKQAANTLRLVWRRHSFVIVFSTFLMQFWTKKSYSFIAEGFTQ